MIPARHLMWLRSLLIIAVVLWVCGCSEEKGTDPPPIDTAKAQQIADQASTSLADLMDSVINTTLDHADSSFRPRDIDFTDVNTTYRSALSVDPNCKDARFGVAFTGLLVVMADPDFNDLVDDFKHLYDTLEINPFRTWTMAPKIDFGGSMLIESVPLSAGGLNDVIPSPLELDLAISKLAMVEPSMSHIQDILETSLLPRLQDARLHLAALVNDSAYTFVITPEMQGNPGASPIVIDRPDFQLFLTMTEAVEAGLQVFFARDLDLSAYNIEGVQEALRKGSNFLSLKEGGVGAAHMAEAKTRVLGCLNGIKQTTVFLEGEIGTSQADDLIKVYSSDLDDLHRLRDSVTSILTYFDGPRQMNIIWETGSYWSWNGDSWNHYVVEDTVSLTVDISKFFDSAMSNFKDFIPDYTATVESVNDLHITFAQNHFSRDRYWAAMDSIFGLTYPNDTPYFADHLPDENTAEFYRLLAEYPSYVQMMFGWDDVYNYCEPGATDPWCYWSSNGSHYSDYWYDQDQIVACYEWDAATFDDWYFPNATLNGLLPEMTSQELKDIWANDNHMGWFKSDCDTVSHENFW